jgi:hypothetical protein
MADPMRVSGQTVIDAYDDWIKTEVKGGPPQRSDLGKFAFSVAVGTLGAVAAIEKLNETARMDIPMFISVMALFGAMVLSLLLAMPHILEVSAESDLRLIHSREVEAIRRSMWIWFVVWAIGAASGGVAISS